MTSNRISGDTWPYSHTNDLHGSGWIGHAAGISAGIIPQVTAVHPDGRRLLRIEAKNAETPIERKPGWIRTTARTGPNYQDLQQIVQKADLHTVCREAHCPNIFECWEDRESTFLIGGDQCTRRCDFCLRETGRIRPGRANACRRIGQEDGIALRHRHRRVPR